MADFLTRRNHTWHFVRRVPTEFAALDTRGIIKHSTKIKIADDRNGRRASRVADKFNKELEAQWQALAGGVCFDQANRYEQVRAQVCTLGFEYLDNTQVISLPLEQRLQRLEALISKGLVNDPVVRYAVLGTEKRPVFMLSELQEEHEKLIADELKEKSPEQLRIWRTERIRAVQQFVDVATDMPVTEITETDGLDYVDWWRQRVVDGEATPGTANKDIGILSRMLKDVSTRKRFKLPEIFKGLRLRGDTGRSRVPIPMSSSRSTCLAAD